MIESVENAEEALAKAQDTPYKLSAAIMTGDQRRGLDMAQRFDAGIVHVNSATMAAEPALPERRGQAVVGAGWGTTQSRTSRRFGSRR